MKLLVKCFVSIMVFISSLLPRPLLRRSGAWLGFLWFDLLGFRKKIILDNLQIAFPEWSEQRRRSIGRTSVYQLGYSLAEFFFIPSMTPEWLKKNVVFEGWEHVEKARSEGKGILLLSMHLGNGDIAANSIVLNGLDLYLITKSFKTKWFNDLWFSIRGAMGVKYIEAHAANNSFEILKALKKNAAVVFVLDQFMGKPFGIATTFFGKRTGTAYGLALFAQKTKSPILPIYTYEGLDKKIHIVFEPALDTSRCFADDKDQTILNLTQSFNDKIEEVVRKHPDQWMWVHRRWKDFE